jgi:hypothetical protein
VFAGGTNIVADRKGLEHLFSTFTEKNWGDSTR